MVSNQHLGDWGSSVLTLGILIGITTFHDRDCHINYCDVPSKVSKQLVEAEDEHKRKNHMKSSLMTDYRRGLFVSLFIENNQKPIQLSEKKPFRASALSLGITTQK